MNIILLIVLLIIVLYVLSPLIRNSNCCVRCGSTEFEETLLGHQIYKCTRCGYYKVIKCKDKECF